MGDTAVVLAGRYRLRERIGAGGMGEVWRATDELLGRTVAIKLILPALLHEPGFVRRFLAEARAMASVRHPGVVAIHDFHGDGASAYLVMEFVEAEPLSRVLGRVGRLGADVTMDLVRQAAEALQAVHDRGIVHRDVKPANLLLRPDGTLALVDFGIALGTETTALTGPGTIIGTPSYLAPEQVMGQPASPRSDVYALGVVAYECLAGRRPFVGDNPFAVAMQRVGQPPPPLGPEVPREVVQVVERALAPDPSMRWPSAADLAIAAEQAGAPITPRRHAAAWQDMTTVRHRDEAMGRPSLGPPRRRRNRAIAVTALVLLVLGAAVIGVVAWRNATERPAAASDGRTNPPTSTATATPGGTDPSSRAQTPAGFAACGDALCPTAPMCWRGLVQQGNVGHPPAAETCTAPHYWETFAAHYLPTDARTDYDLTHLMDRADFAGLCSAGAMASHSSDPARTQGWRREAWPIPADPYTVLVHCLAGAEEGETPGAVFTSG
jgi:eukaryotic-like serine/threonine-protein kinase